MPRFAVFGNFDAELELFDPDARRSPRRRALCTELTALLRRELAALGIDAQVVDPERGAEPHGLVAGTPVVCWMPTPQAIEALRRLGATACAPVPADTLRRVNSRAFAHAIAAGFDGDFVSELCTDPGSAIERIEALTQRGPVLCKRMLGFAGRMQKRIGRGGLADAERSWVRGSFDGLAPGLLIEEPVTLLGEWSCHAVLGSDGELVRRGVVSFRCDERGSFVAASEAGDLAREREERLLECQSVVASALTEVGYRGPFAFDSFAYHTTDGREGFRVLSDLNARLTRTSFAPTLASFDPTILA